MSRFPLWSGVSEEFKLFEVAGAGGTFLGEKNITVI